MCAHDESIPRSRLYATHTYSVLARRRLRGERKSHERDTRRSEVYICRRACVVPGDAFAAHRASTLADSSIRREAAAEEDEEEDEEPSLP